MNATRSKILGENLRQAAWCALAFSAALGWSLVPGVPVWMQWALVGAGCLAFGSMVGALICAFVEWRDCGAAATARQHELDRLAMRYLAALDAEDFRTIAALWRQAATDRQLADMLHGLNIEYAASPRPERQA